MDKGVGGLENWTFSWTPYVYHPQGRIRVSENRYSRIFYAVMGYNSVGLPFTTIVNLLLFIFIHMTDSNKRVTILTQTNT